MYYYIICISANMKSIQGLWCVCVHVCKTETEAERKNVVKVIVLCVLLRESGLKGKKHSILAEKCILLGSIKFMKEKGLATFSGGESYRILRNK